MVGARLVVVFPSTPNDIDFNILTDLLETFFHPEGNLVENLTRVAEDTLAHAIVVYRVPLYHFECWTLEDLIESVLADKVVLVHCNFIEPKIILLVPILGILLIETGDVHCEDELLKRRALMHQSKVGVDREHINAREPLEAGEG